MSQTEENKNQESQERQEILEEIESVNEATKNQVIDEEEAPIVEGPSEIDKLKAELAESNNKYVRLYAEFDNYKRRTSKERTELLQTAGKDIIASLLPVVDDFERALNSMETATDINSVKEGINLIQQKLNNLLSQRGLKPMETKGLPFDADLHEAITSIPAPTDDLKGKVVDELEKGYTLNDKVIRFAKVVVGA
ncbi:MAG: GrpE protein [Sphingobacteriales bacterium]|nr:GrpE protein [Sphingobacteriales bacterium]